MRCDQLRTNEDIDSALPTTMIDTGGTALRVTAKLPYQIWQMSTKHGSISLPSCSGVYVLDMLGETEVGTANGRDVGQEGLGFDITLH